MLIHLLDMLLTFQNLSQDRSAVTAQLEQLATILSQALTHIEKHDWHGYRSDRIVLRVQHVLHIADSLRSASDSVSIAEEWTNLSEALVGLARLHAQLRMEPIAIPADERLPATLAEVSEKVFSASLGPLLTRFVQQRRLARVTADYVLIHGEDGIAMGLRVLEQAAAASAALDEQVINGTQLSQLAELAVQVGQSPSDLLSGVIEALQQRRVPEWVEKIGLATTPLPIEIPGLYGDDPVADEIVRPLLHQIARALDDYPIAKWSRLIDMLVSLTKFAHYVRDATQEYVWCEEDGGLGQRASEDDLQRHLFEWLRQRFGRQVIHEYARLGGGRVDTCVVFPEAEFPIEVKHEFRSIDVDYMRRSFLSQPDVYATAADRVAFLMVLDLRASNAGGHRDRLKMDRRSDSQTEPMALYHLRDSFRMYTLIPDPDISNPTSKVVVIGLIPGNRPSPSSLSTYSRRPASVGRNRPSSSGSGDDYVNHQ